MKILVFVLMFNVYSLELIDRYPYFLKIKCIDIDSNFLYGILPGGLILFDKDSLQIINQFPMEEINDFNGRVEFYDLFEGNFLASYPYIFLSTSHTFRGFEKWRFQGTDSLVLKKRWIPPFPDSYTGVLDYNGKYFALIWQQRVNYPPYYIDHVSVLDTSFNELGRLQFNYFADRIDILLDSTFCFVPEWNAGGINIIDISDPTNPYIVNSINIQALHVEKYDSILIAATQDRVVFINIKDVYNPFIIGQVYSYGRRFDDAKKIQNYVYAFDELNGEWIIINIENLHNPFIERILPMPGGKAISPFKFLGNYLYTPPVMKFDVSNPSNPTLTNSYIFYAPYFINYQQDSFLYTFSPYGNRILNSKNFRKKSEIGYFLPDIWTYLIDTKIKSLYCYNVYRHYIIDNKHFLEIDSISNFNFIKLSEVIKDNVELSNVEAGDTVLILMGHLPFQNGMMVYKINIKTRSNPVQTDSVFIPDFNPHDQLILGDTLLVTTTYDGLVIYSIKSYNFMQVLKKYEGLGNLYNLFYSDSLLFVSKENSVWVLNIKDINNIVPLAEIEGAGGKIFAKDTLLFVGDSLSVFNIKNPIYPEFLCRFPVRAQSFYYTFDTLFISSEYGILKFILKKVSVSENYVKNNDKIMKFFFPKNKILIPSLNNFNYLIVDPSGRVLRSEIGEGGYIRLSNFPDRSSLFFIYLPSYKKTIKIIRFKSWKF